MNEKKNTDGGHDLSTHHLLEIREPPENLVALRNELMEVAHDDIRPYLQEGKTFEDVLGRIGVRVNIALDGEYDANDICGVLCTALRNKRFGTGDPRLEPILGLLEAGLVEREGTIELVDFEAERSKKEAEETPAPKIILN